MAVKKITVRFPERLKKEMQEAVIKSGYGFHGKSKWLAEAVSAFLQQPNFLELVEHGVNINQAMLTTVEAFYLDDATIKEIKLALFTIRSTFPLFEGVQSALIRSAVVFRLLFPQKFPPGEF